MVNMNMIVNSSDLVGYEAEIEKQGTWSKEKALNKVVKAWESKQARAAKRVGGVSLLAVSLAACNSDDDTTPFSQADVDSAKAAATTAALTSSDGTVHASVDAAITAASSADATAALTDASGTVHATVDAAMTSNDAAITTAALTAADGTIYANVDAAHTAGSLQSNSAAVTAALTDSSGTVHATVDAAMTSNDAAITTAATNAAEATLLTGSGFTTVASLISSYNALNSPTPNTSALTTAADNVFGTTSNDAITSTSANLGSADVISDGSTTDSDTVTVTATTDITNTPTIAGIENLVVNLDSFTAAGGSDTNANASNAAGSSFEIKVDNVAGGTLTVDNVKAGSGIAEVIVTSVPTGMVVTTSDDFTAVELSTENNADVTVNTAAAMTNIDVLGTTPDAVTITGNNTMAGITTSSDGTLTVTGTGAAKTVTVAAADSVTSLTGTSAGPFVITTADASAAFTLSAVGTTTDSSITGTISTGATASLSGNGGAVDFDLTGLDKVTAITFTGDQNVRAIVSGADIDGNANLTALADAITVTDNTTAGTTTLEVNAIGTINTSLVNADVIDISIDFDNDAITTGAAQTLMFSVDQTAGTAAPNIVGPATTASSNTLTVNLDDGAYTAAGAVDAVLNIDNIKTTTINANDPITASTLTSIDVGTANDLVVTSTGKGVAFAGTSIANKLTLTTPTATTVGTAHTINELDASGSAGAITVTLDATLATVTTGSGNDAITAVTADTNTIDGGAGTDTVTIPSGANLSAQTASLANVEILNFAGNAEIDDVFVGSQAIIMKGAATVITIQMTSATVDFSNLVIDDSTLAGSDKITIDETGLTAFGLNITGSAMKDDIDGGGVVDVLNGGAGADTIDGAAGNDTINGGDGADTLNGDADVDTITGGEGADIINGGAGIDVIILTETTAAIDVLTPGSSFANRDTVTGFDLGTSADSINVTTATATGAVSQNDLGSAVAIGGVSGAGKSIIVDANGLMTVIDELVAGGGDDTVIIPRASELSALVTQAVGEVTNTAFLIHYDNDSNGTADSTLVVAEHGGGTEVMLLEGTLATGLATSPAAGQIDIQ